MRRGRFATAAAKHAGQRSVSTVLRSKERRMRRIPRRGARAFCGAWTWALCLASAAPAAAQSASNSAAAQALFDEARALMARGNTAEACPKFEESQRLDPGSGTLLNLARCYETAGRFASAWDKYLEAAAAAKVVGNAQREKEARSRATALRPRLSTLTIRLAPGAEAIEGLTISRDGESVGAAQFGLALPADAGEHTLSASAPGYATWQTKISVKPEATAVSVTVPVLAPVASPAALARSDLTASPPSEPAPTQQRPPALGTQRVLSLVAAGVGVLGVGSGVVFGLRSKSKHDEAEKYCDGPLCTDQRGVDAGNSAHAAGNVATVTTVVGLAGLAGAAALWFSAPRERRSAATELRLGLGRAELRGVW